MSNFFKLLKLLKILCIVHLVQQVSPIDEQVEILLQSDGSIPRFDGKHYISYFHL